MALKYTPIGGIFGPLVDAKCNTKQQQNLAKIMNKTTNKLCQRHWLALTQARN